MYDPHLLVVVELEPVCCLILLSSAVLAVLRGFAWGLFVEFVGPAGLTMV